MARKKKDLQIDVQKRIVDMSFGLTDLITCRLIGNADSEADTAQMRLMRAPEESGEIDIGMQVPGMAALEVLHSYLGEFITRMKSPGVH